MLSKRLSPKSLSILASIINVAAQVAVKSRNIHIFTVMFKLHFVFIMAVVIPKATKVIVVSGPHVQKAVGIGLDAELAVVLERRGG